MTNEPLKQRPFPHHGKPKPPRKEKGMKAKSRVAEFLIDSNVLPLVLVGKGVKCFGWGTVAAFIVGALSVYGYAVAVNPLPFAKDHTRTVRLSGIVRDAKQKPINENIWAGVLAKQQGPLADGSFTMEVPESSSYDVALWNNEGFSRVFTGMPAEQDNRGLKVPFALTIPATEQSAAESANPKLKDEIARANGKQ